MIVAGDARAINYRTMQSIEFNARLCFDNDESFAGYEGWGYRVTPEVPAALIARTRQVRSIFSSLTCSFAFEPAATVENGSMQQRAASPRLGVVQYRFIHNLQ